MIGLRSGENKRWTFQNLLRQMWFTANGLPEGCVAFYVAQRVHHWCIFYC